MKKIKINNLILQYFKAFNSKNLSLLEKMFSKNIILKDWERISKGRVMVLEENKKIFKNVISIKCKIKKKFFIQNIAICVLQIYINKKEKLDVVDIIEFNKKNEISRITAFKG